MKQICLPSSRWLRGTLGAALLIGVSVLLSNLRPEMPTSIAPGPTSLIPAFASLVVVLATRRVLLGLGLGVVSGALLLPGTFVDRMAHAVVLVGRQIVHLDHVKIMVFSGVLAAMMAILSQSGFMESAVGRITRRIRGRRGATMATTLLGTAMFFDDYASTLLVGSSMRPVTDRWRVSREKLAYLVDTTAAAVASLAMISTWIGYEISVMQQALDEAHIAWNAYELFLVGLPSRFYPIFALVFAFTIAATGRDFGPMLKAEIAGPPPDADQAEEKSLHPRGWLYAVVSLLALLLTVVVWLYLSGRASLAELPGETSTFVQLRTILAHANAYDALLYGSLAGALIAASCAVVSRSLSVKSTGVAVLTGFRQLLPAILVLCLAWSLGEIISEVQTGPYLAGILVQELPAQVLPAAIFITAAAVSFATGTSWGTMAILFPIAMPVVAAYAGTDAFDTLLIGTSSAVLAGGIFGDHCSPLSDTTVLSSVASGCDLFQHTITQAPYAAFAGVLSIFVGYLPLGWGAPPLVLLMVGTLLTVGWVRWVGRTPESKENGG